MQVYIAGPLFTDNEIAARRREEAIMEIFNPKITIFNPISAPYNEDKDSALPTPQSIYLGDKHEIEKSDFLVFNFEDMADPGVSLELGLAIGCGTTIIGVFTDIRSASTASYDISPFGMNHMVLGAVLTEGYITHSYEDAAKLVARLSSQ